MQQHRDVVASLVRDGKVRFVDEGTVTDHILAGHTTSPTTTDWDGDGTREILIGAEDGFFYHAPIR